MIKRCALVGNQNSGKTLLFNHLTGLNQKVGNWPGVTVDRKDGVIRGTDIAITDLPGIYSLSPYTSEEEISRQFIVNDKPDLIINIIDSTSIERALYLTTQLIELGIPVIAVLNMQDILSKKGLAIDVKKLESILGIKCVSISALKKTGIKELINTIKNFNNTRVRENKIFNKEIESLVSEIEKEIDNDIFEKRFAAIKIFERDKRYYNKYYAEKFNEKIELIERAEKLDSEEIIAGARYDYIEKIRDAVVTKTKKNNVNLTAKADKILLNKWFAIPIFLIIMVLIYLLSVGLVGGATVNIVDILFNGGDTIEFPLPWAAYEVSLGDGITGLGPLLSDSIINAGGSAWAASLVADGVVAGVGAVLNFVPQIMILFLLLSLLETSGYMGRVTFLFDRLFKKLGMSGQSLIPFIVGTGCSVPAIMGSRTIENKNEHQMTVTLTPFMPCSAKLPIISCFVGGIFGANWLVTAGMYILAIVVIILSGFILNKFFVKNKSTSYIQELPNYHIPSASYVLQDVGSKTWAFIKRAGTIIFLCSIVVWILLNVNYQFQYVENVDESLLADIGRSISWIFAPMLGMNFSWGASVSAIQGLVAKEQVISSMEIITAVGEGGNVFGGNGMFSFFNGFSAMGYMIFTLFSAPCFGAIGAMKRELNSGHDFWRAILFQTGLAWLLASLVGIWGALL